jgi:hypothetical protein
MTHIGFQQIMCYHCVKEWSFHTDPVVFITWISNLQFCPIFRIPVFSINGLIISSNTGSVFYPGKMDQITFPLSQDKASATISDSRASILVVSVSKQNSSVPVQVDYPFKFSFI